MFACNHNSSGDIAVLFSLFLPYKFVSKHQNFWAPFLGWNMHLNRYVSLRRGDPESVKKMMATCEMWLRRGVSIMMFPEGTRSRTSCTPERTTSPTTVTSRLPGVAVVPIVLDGTFEALPPNGILSQSRIVPVRARICEPIESADFTDVAAFSDAVRTRMVEEQARLRLLPGARGPRAAQG